LNGKGAGTNITGGGGGIKGVKSDVVICISEATPVVAELDSKIVGLSPPTLELASFHHKSV
jgi:hypothetical protein